MIILVGSTFCMVGFIVILYFIRNGKPSSTKAISGGFLFLYLLLVFSVTLILRDGSVSTGLTMQPFIIFTLHDNHKIAEMILNIILFIPFGFLACGAKKSIGILHVCCVGCGLSLIIELLQLLTQRGVCNINDVIHNTLGCIIGYGIYRLCNTILTVSTK